MNNTKTIAHTPGPWIVDGDNEDEYIIRAWPNDEGIDICSFECDESNNVKANARLIAAAPLMKEENKRLNEVNAELARENAELREQVAQLLQAIEAMHEAEQSYFKARGKEQIAVALVRRVKADELAEAAIQKAKGE
jgi:hypothetical protein